MVERVIVETDGDSEVTKAKAALARKGCYTVTDLGAGALAVLVPDSRDAEEEITELMNDAAVSCFVCLSDDI